MLYWRIHETNNTLIRKQFTKVINQVRGSVIFLISFTILPLFETSVVVPCWPLEIMQVKDSSALAPSIFHTGNHSQIRHTCNTKVTVANSHIWIHLPSPFCCVTAGTPVSYLQCHKKLLILGSRGNLFIPFSSWSLAWSLSVHNSFSRFLLHLRPSFCCNCLLHRYIV